MFIENDFIRVTISEIGGHIAEIQDLATGVNPLWTPPWASEPHADFGNNAESKLLAGIRGHNLCLDLFGQPSEAEAKAGMIVHGEAGVAAHTLREIPGGLVSQCLLPHSQLAFERTITLDGRTVRIAETVENLSIFDRPIAWTQHVTFGPPFMEHGVTQFRWPYTDSEELNEAYAAYLMKDPAWFVAWSPVHRLAIGYRWNRADFPWLGIWKENRGRTHAPWNGRTVTQGMEFGVSPIPETRRAMIDRGTLFGTPCYRWIEAKQELSVEYSAAIWSANSLPESFSSLS